MPYATEVQYAVEELQKINPDITYRASIRRLEWPVNEADREKRVTEAVQALTALNSVPRDNPVVEFARGRVSAALSGRESKNHAFITSADEPDSLRGVQAHYAVGINLHKWAGPRRYGSLTALDNLRIATRLGRTPKIVLTHNADYEKIDGAQYTMG